MIMRIECVCGIYVNKTTGGASWPHKPAVWCKAVTRGNLGELWSAYFLRELAPQALYGFKILFSCHKVTLIRSPGTVNIPGAKEQIKA